MVCDKARQASLNSVSLWKQDLDDKVQTRRDER